MFKNTLVDEIFKTAISSHHLRHTVKQITKAVDIQSRPILPIACTRVESNFVYFINRKTNQRVFKKCCDHFTDQPLQRCLSHAQHCKYCVKLNLIAVSNRGPITKPECQNCVFAAVKLLLLTAIISSFFVDPRPFIFPELLPFMVERYYGLFTEHDLQNIQTFISAFFTQKPVSYLNGLVRVFIGVG